MSLIAPSRIDLDDEWDRHPADHDNDED